VTKSKRISDTLMLGAASAPTAEFSLDQYLRKTNRMLCDTSTSEAGFPGMDGAGRFTIPAFRLGVVAKKADVQPDFDLFSLTEKDKARLGGLVVPAENEVQQPAAPELEVVEHGFPPLDELFGKEPEKPKAGNYLFASVTSLAVRCA
jgi:hypothetical protein